MESNASMRPFARFWTVRCLILLMLLIGGKRCRAAEPESPHQELKTEHYDLYVESIDAKEVGSLVEQLHGVLKDFFSREPVGRARVNVYSSRERFLDAAIAAGVKKESLEQGKTGVCCDGICYVAAALNNPQATREMILHECTHQFHLSGRTEVPRSHYYVEGLAEHFAVHQWKDDKTYVPDIPDLEYRHRPIMALRAFRDRHHGNFRSVAVDSSEPDYDEAWALVTFLVSEHPKEFHRWAAALDRTLIATTAWDEAFTDVSDDVLSKQFLDWLLAHQNAWTVHRGTWRNPSKGIMTGDAPRWADAFSNNSRTFLEASVHVTGIETVAGVTIRGKKGWTPIVVTQKSEVLSFLEDKWVPVRANKKVHVKDPTNFKIQVALENSQAVIRIDGVDAAEVEVSGEMFLSLTTGYGAATFSDIQTR